MLRPSRSRANKSAITAVSQDRIAFSFFAFDLAQVTLLPMETQKLLTVIEEIVERDAELAGEPFSGIVPVRSAAIARREEAAINERIIVPINRLQPKAVSRHRVTGMPVQTAPAPRICICDA